MLEDLQEELADIRAEDDVLQRHMYFVGWITAIAAIFAIALGLLSLWLPQYKHSSKTAMGAYLPAFAAWVMLCQKSRALTTRMSAVHDRLITRCEVLRVWSELKEVSNGQNHQ